MSFKISETNNIIDAPLLLLLRSLTCVNGLLIRHIGSAKLTCPKLMKNIPLLGSVWFQSNKDYNKFGRNKNKKSQSKHPSNIF